MAQIGSFKRDNSGVYTGTIRTLTLNAKITLRPSKGEHDKAPDHKVMSGAVEIGAAWTKTSREGETYLSLKLDDPSFATPVYATLVRGEADEHKLIWSR